MVHNVLALGEEADFEALNFLPANNLIRSTKLHLSTEPAFLPNACYKPFYYLNRFSSSNILSDFMIKPKLFGILEIAIGLSTVGTFTI